MKRILLLPFVLGVMISNAQLKLGAKGGVNVSNFTGLDNVEKDPLVGFHAGLVSRFILNHLVLQPELLYSVQGAKITETGGTKTDYKVDYINVPIMLQWAFGGSFYAELGPQAGFRVSDNLPNNVNAKSTDWAGAIGAGFLKREGGIGLGARYTMGFTKVAEVDTGGDDFKNGVFQVSLFYFFK
jgi:hypothetical protein